MSDINCPYCDAELEVCHDDGFGYDEYRNHEMQCGECEKNFVFTTSIIFHYRPEKADCLNGQPHKMKPVISSAKNIWPDWARCEDCDHEVRGEYVEPEESPKSGGMGGD